jgi:L-2-hydroxyglutarate oxidase LhgO
VDFCRQRDLPLELCGKLVVATEQTQVPRLDELERRGRANGLRRLRRVSSRQIPDHEPYARGLDALLVPETGIVDFVRIAEALAEELQRDGGDVFLGRRVRAIATAGDELVVETDGGALQAGRLVNCAGLHSDRVARLAGLRPAVRIVPFRGDYFELAAERRSLVRGLIYPVPDPRFPFLGVHLTRRIDGSVEAGPNAVLALHRDRYSRRAFSRRDAWSTLSYPGFWRLAGRYWRIGLAEMLRAGSRRRFIRALRRFVPQLAAEDLIPGGCGIRAQALDRRGTLVDDFVLAGSPRALHVLNAPSPAATASLAIADELADLAVRELGLG